jgi:hypothetical protein
MVQCVVARREHRFVEMGIKAKTMCEQAECGYRCVQQDWGWRPCKPESCLGMEYSSVWFIAGSCMYADVGS